MGTFIFIASLSPSSDNAALFQKDEIGGEEGTGLVESGTQPPISAKRNRKTPSLFPRPIQVDIFTLPSFFHT